MEPTYVTEGGMKSVEMFKCPSELWAWYENIANCARLHRHLETETPVERYFKICGKLQKQYANRAHGKNSKLENMMRN